MNSALSFCRSTRRTHVPSRLRARHALPLVVFLSLGCSSSSSSPDAAPTGAGGTSAAGGSTAAGGSAGESSTGGAGGGTPFDGLNGCNDADFVNGAADPLDRVVIIDGTSLTFKPRCLAISAGESVQFVGDFSTHPIAPGSSPMLPDTGSPANPIEATSSGKSQTFTFSFVGTYPYICSVHFGSGMMGAIRVYLLTSRQPRARGHESGH